ncbi:LPXTG cell wall anchor domain-containing protein [Microbacterium sp. SYP-A9085]|uniref:LPXTG cell wall anchor domain-containing protein n=1 Tax=Microbacterium sp. SYP-A9085 TaxID=2664454 RepID=UPI00129B7F04|nr:LPXTG cell wall anchor domain-containing protein [Microbacterium sp. SYP-A9085]MRH29159.1 LPXTG cell wall anchor domain-containing protein [Microbacterium sp. SYP-A9085]
MKNKLLKAGVIASVAAGAALLAPAAAQAATIYPPTNACSISPATITPGGTVDFSCGAGTFSANEKVTITITGEDGANVKIGFVKFAISTASGTSTSAADGSLAAVPLAFPADASGAYNIAAVSPTSAGGTASVAVAAAGGGSSAELPVTGMDSSQLLGFWIGGGALVLAGGAFAVAASVRRNRKQARA